nr:7364_t:CDS:1 [Entrophospora candida]
MVTIQDLCGSKCSEEEWSEYCWMPVVRTNETPSEWKERIWVRLQYFRENDLLPYESKDYFKARKLIQFPDGNSYAPCIGIVICLSCNQLVHTGEYIKRMEIHWKFSCTGNKYCRINYEEYMKIKQKPESERNFDNIALNYYELWKCNAISRIERAREVGKKIRACTIIQKKFIEYYYRPDGDCATELANHYKILRSIREEMRQVNSV